MGGVDPAVVTPAKIVDDRVGIANSETSIELGAFIGHPVAGGVFEKPDVGGCRGNGAIAIEDKTGDEFEVLSEDLFGVHNTVTISVAEDGNAVFGAAFRLAGFEGTGVLPDGGLGDAAAVGILRSFADPEAAFFVPSHVHDFFDQRFRGDEFDLEFGMNFEVGGGFARMNGPVGGVDQGVAELGRNAKLVDIGTMTGPRDTAKEDGAVIGAGEVFVVVAGNRDERSVGLRIRQKAAFVGPHLGLMIVDVYALLGGDGCGGARLGLLVALTAGVDGLGGVGGGEDVDIVGEIHVVVDLVVHGPVGNLGRDRVVAVDKVEVHGRFEPLGRALFPRTSDDGLIPSMFLFGDGAGVDGDNTTAAGKVIVEIGAVVAGDVPCIVGVEHQNVGLRELGSGGKLDAAGGDGAASVE